jgi:hypothetical protein
VQPATANDEHGTPASNSRVANKLLDPVASDIGTKTMKVACALSTHVPPGKCPQGFPRDAVACPRDHAVLTLNNQLGGFK